MAVTAPSGLAVSSVVSPSATLGAGYVDVHLSWTNGQTYTVIELDYSTDAEVTWLVASASIIGTRTVYTHATGNLNAETDYRVRGYKANDGGWSDWSTTLETHIYSDTEAETFTATEGYTHGGTTGGSGPTAAADTEAETVTMTDVFTDAVISKTDIAYFLGTATGAVHKYSTAYHGDNGTAIVSTWESKEIDFNDQYPQFDNKWKTVDRVWIRYVDKDTVTLSVSLTIDNGATWETVSRSLGTGTGYIKEVNFDFRKSGRFFKVRIQESSADKDFQITDLWLEFYPGGDYFSLS